jgi:hypothetical protein
MGIDVNEVAISALQEDDAGLQILEEFILAPRPPKCSSWATFYPDPRCRHSKQTGDNKTPVDWTV